uniref:Uncharacterized protein n=1 Tax=Cacopsylla melanoneura TaxID=428564 RepID=A0A8D8WF09_9HEMI
MAKWVRVFLITIFIAEPFPFIKENARGNFNPFFIRQKGSLHQVHNYNRKCSTYCQHLLEGSFLLRPEKFRHKNIVQFKAKGKFLGNFNNSYGICLFILKATSSIFSIVPFTYC